MFREKLRFPYFSTLMTSTYGQLVIESSRIFIRPLSRAT